MKAPIFLILCGFLIGCFRLPPESEPEEFLEDVIEDATGLDIDLTSDDGR